MKYCVAITLAALLSAVPCPGRDIPSAEGSAAKTSGAASLLEILSDTRGVNFAPHLSRVLISVRTKWHGLIPQEARAPEMKQGNVDVEFKIDQKGVIRDPQIVTSSGDESLDSACTKAILQAAPFDPLPAEYKEGVLFLRFHFHYNPPKAKPESQASHP